MLCPPGLSAWVTLDRLSKFFIPIEVKQRDLSALNLATKVLPTTCITQRNPGQSNFLKVSLSLAGIGEPGSQEQRSQALPLAVIITAFPQLLHYLSRSSAAVPWTREPISRILFSSPAVASSFQFLTVVLFCLLYFKSLEGGLEGGP